MQGMGFTDTCFAKGMQGAKFCTVCLTTEFLAQAMQGTGQPWRTRSRRCARWLSGVMPRRG